MAGTDALAQDFPSKPIRIIVPYVKANPGKLNYGSPGDGSAGQDNMERQVKVVRESNLKID